MKNKNVPMLKTMLLVNELKNTSIYRSEPVQKQVIESEDVVRNIPSSSVDKNELATLFEELLRTHEESGRALLDIYKDAKEVCLYNLSINFNYCSSAAAVLNHRYIDYIHLVNYFNRFISKYEDKIEQYVDFLYMYWSPDQPRNIMQRMMFGKTFDFSNVLIEDVVSKKIKGLGKIHETEIKENHLIRAGEFANELALEECFADFLHYSFLPETIKRQVKLPEGRADVVVYGDENIVIELKNEIAKTKAVYQVESYENYLNGFKKVLVAPSFSDDAIELAKKLGVQCYEFSIHANCDSVFVHFETKHKAYDDKVIDGLDEALANDTYFNPNWIIQENLDNHKHRMKNLTNKYENIEQLFRTYIENDANVKG